MPVQILTRERRQLVVTGKIISEFIVSWMVVVVGFGSSGCRQLDTPTPGDLQSLLHPVEAAEKSVTLEIYQLRFPADHQGLVKDVWQEIDEQRLPVALRRDLVRNGFRTGILGGALPDSLAAALNLQSQIPENSASRLLTGQSAQPDVVRRVLQLDPKEHAVIQASELLPQLNLMLCNENGLHGDSFTQVEAAFELQAETIPGQRVVVQLTPELHHGELRNRYTSRDQGIIMMTPSREHEVYEHLQIRTELSPGEILVVGCPADSTNGSLGHTFHTTNQQGRSKHKLVLVRLLQVPPSEILVAQ